MPSQRLLLASAACATLVALAVGPDALACACCSSPGQRNVAMVPFDALKRDEIGRLQFAGTAQLFSGEASEPADIKGIATPAARYELSANWDKDRLVFAFRDPAGRSGTLSLRRPSRIAIFEVDPRTPASEGEPLLYKEWKLTARAAGSGVFSAGLGPSQQLSLILHGRGNSCTSAEQFTHWTLEMKGPKANYLLFGELVTTP